MSYAPTAILEVENNSKGAVMPMQKRLTVWLPIMLVLQFSIGFLQGSAQATSRLDYNMPDELRECIREQSNIEPNVEINPFYLSGNFDADGLTDFAVQVKNLKGGQHGILFCFASGKRVLWGAGVPNKTLVNGKWPFDSWMLIRKGSKHLSIYPKIKNDVIVLTIADEGGGLLYWNVSALVWVREE
jgi:hypothetical protein